MTVLQSLAIKILMLGITVGVIYWGVSTEDPHRARAPEASIVSDSIRPPHEESAVKRDQPPESEPRTGVEEPLRNADQGPTGGRKVAVVAPAEPAPASVRRAKSFLAPPVRRPVRFPIDLNKAPMHDLLELPGIGEKLGERIVQYRKDHGPFQSIEDLRKVKGIGKKRMERLRPLVMTAGAHD